MTAVLVRRFSTNPQDHPGWSSLRDYDRSQSADGRVELVGGSELLIVGTHFAGSSAGHIIREANSSRFAPI